MCSNMSLAPEESRVFNDVLFASVGQVSFGVRSASSSHDLVWVFGSCSSAGACLMSLFTATDGPSCRLADPAVGLAQSSLYISTCASSIAEH